jgi:prevent-host-death family protein
MKRAKISELRNRLSQYLDHVRAGGRVLILDRNRPIAEIVPIRNASAASGSDVEHLAILEREGIIRRGSGKPPKLPSVEDLPGEGSGVLAALLEERERGR